LPDYRSRIALASAKFAMPFPSHKPPLFWLISPEAGLLTEVHLILLTRLNESKTEERRADRKAGGGVWQGGQKLFSVLTFWLLLGQAKSN